MREPYVDPKTGLHVLCPICRTPVSWNNRDWHCTNDECRYIGAEALFPQEQAPEQVIGVKHPQPPDQHIVLDLDPVSAAFLQRVSRKWGISSQEAVISLIKSAAKLEFSPKETSHGTDEVRNPRERSDRQQARDD